MCVETKQNYKYNCLQKRWKLYYSYNFGAPRNLFSLMVNPRLDVIMFSQPRYALFVKNSLAFTMIQQVNSPVYTDVNRFSYIYTELSVLALRNVLVKFNPWNISTT